MKRHMHRRDTCNRGSHRRDRPDVFTVPPLLITFDIAIGWHDRIGPEFLEVEMMNKRPQPPQPDRIRSIKGSFSWIDHRFLRQGFDQGLTRVEKLLYFVLIAVSNSDGVSFYSDERLWEILKIQHGHELDGARSELVARDLIAFKNGIYQVLDLPPGPGAR